MSDRASKALVEALLRFETCVGSSESCIANMIELALMSVIKYKM
jgi:hypothetical protein